MLLIVKLTYKKQGLKDKGKEAEKRSKGLLALLGVKDSEPLKLSLIGKGMRDQIITMPNWAASLPRTLLPLQSVLPVEHGESSWGQPGVPGLPGMRYQGDPLSPGPHSRRLKNWKNHTLTG